ncbi:hypothetical protein [Paenibacillus naphthalenovorans]|uniref:Uncharacterized protein n=1 Tax=Paenibacillus naphthalenovorans TaxID=162209 RepID=A0A0U2UGE8_9BACL|nr:hypothetical protein [Paenibacillus naphthalenovorans]ALS22268.1 hypothetical protein IJ22_18940 [Paenibacillus naphthalenovorans]
MKVLTLNFNEETEASVLEFQEGTYESWNNYVRECCESTFHVEFNYKGIDFSEELVVKALTDHFSTFDEPVNSEEFHNMFRDHSKHVNDNEMTKIKRICLNYLRKVLFED